jgi:ABC-2 type transport system ATP-binding protein
VAAALVHNPEVIFLDEPTTGLDPASRVSVWREVRKLNAERGTTIFLTTQYLEEADELADRVGIISDGRIVAEGTPDELKRSIGDDLIVARVDGSSEEVAKSLDGVPGVHHVSVRDGVVTVRAPDGAAAISPVAVALSHSRLHVHSLTLRTPTLDDVFLELTGGHIEHLEPEEGE